MATPYSCKFQRQWLTKKEYKDWIQEVPRSQTKAYCKACSKTIELSNMGQTALTSHMKGKKHSQAISQQNAASSITAFFPKDQPEDKDQQKDKDQPEDEDQQKDKDQPEDISKKNKISTHMKKSDVQIAEILWAIKSVVSHYSYQSSSDVGDIFRRMFPDSDIAEKFQCASTKMAYLVCFGISPYFTECLIDKIRAAPCYVVSFDESLNKICQEGQMDLIVRYFHRDKVISQYFQSQFLEHATATDLVCAFKEGTKNLNPSKLLQVSMDGPNVNFKMIDELMKDRQQIDPNFPKVLQLGSCSLHIVHGAFSTGMQKTGWDLDRLLRAIWYLFADSPARRKDFKEITKTDVFGLQFCSTRWVEDVVVAERAVEIWPHVVKYVTETLKKPKKLIPTSASFKTVQEFVVNDPLVLAKLEVFISTAKLVQPFLRKYQTDKPVMPFIAYDLTDVVRSLMTRFIKESVLEDAQTAYKLATLHANDESIWLHVDKVDPGFAAKRILEQALKAKTISPLARKTYLTACQKLYSTMTHKILERCPLKYSMVRGLRALDPHYMVNNKKAAADKMRSVLEKLVDAKWVEDRECDELLHQFRELLELLQRRYKMECESFTFDTDRLDTFFHSVIGLAENAELKELWKLLQCLLTLSHGQAAVERGFSINSAMLAPNLKKRSLVAQRMIYDTVILSEVPVANFEVTPRLLRSCSHAHARYSEFLKEQKETVEKQKKENKRAAEESELIQAKKKLKQMEQTAESLVKDADKQALQAEQKSNFTLLTKSNALRQKAKEMEKDMKKQKDLIAKISANLKTV